MRNTFFVPVRESKAGTLALRTGRLPSGERVEQVRVDPRSAGTALAPVRITPRPAHLGRHAA